MMMLINEAHRVHFELTKDTSYLIFAGVNYGVFIDFGDNIVMMGSQWE